jgi:hypothetical protein
MLMKKTDNLFFLVIAVLMLGISLKAQTAFTPSALKALGAPNNPKVQLTWNRYYDTEQIHSILVKLNQAYPALTKLESIGKTYLGKDIWCITITNSGTGKDSDKPAYYIDANIHANEIQGSEAALYTAWYLLESCASNNYVKELLDKITFYIIPTQSGDSRDKFLHEAATADSPRPGQVPRDDDGDGLVNEDKEDDLNNDGYITQMRIRIKGGRWKTDPDDPRIMVRCKADEEGEFEMLGSEGIDNDGDGLVNEDSDGSYDPNRNWGWLWKPNYIQGGADRYPFSLPETKAVADFLQMHPNILASESYHNSGGMILIGPDQNDQDIIYPQDIQVIDYFGGKGKEILPSYTYINTYKGMYPTYGDETNWQYACLGIMPFVNELWSTMNMFRRENPDPEARQKEPYVFDKELLFKEAFINWQEFDHPQYGKIDIGGFKKQFGRMPPSFLLEEECHRNMAFTLLHASQLPVISIDEVTKKSLGNNMYKVSAVIRNSKNIPTKLAVDAQNKLSRPDRINLKGPQVISGGIKLTRVADEFTEQKNNPDKIVIGKIEGNSSLFVDWIVQGNGAVTIEYDSPKAGRVTKTIK